MKWIVENWTLLVVLVAAVVVVVRYVKKFTELPSEQQIAKVKAMLLLWVTLAEKDFGEKTGVLKLRWVYSQFIDKFEALAPVIPFETFSEWVDEALEEMKHILSTNKEISNFVEGD